MQFQLLTAIGDVSGHCLLLLQYVVDCSTAQNLPTIAFTTNGMSFPLPPSAYILSVCIMYFIDINNSSFFF